MRKRVMSITVLAVVLLIGTCFQFGSLLPQPARVLSQSGDTDNADFLIWQRTIGVTPTQIVRITMANLSTGRQAQPLTFQCAVFDRNGTRVFNSSSIEVPAGGFRHVDVRYDDLDIVFEAGTGRKQASLQLAIQEAFISSYQVSGGDSTGLVGSLELIDATGKTTIYQTIRLQDLSKAR